MTSGVLKIMVIKLFYVEWEQVSKAGQSSFAEKWPFFWQKHEYIYMKNNFKQTNHPIFWIYNQFPFQWYIIHIHISVFVASIIFSQKKVGVSILVTSHLEPCHMQLFCYLFDLLAAYRPNGMKFLWQGSRCEVTNSDTPTFFCEKIMEATKTEICE